MDLIERRLKHELALARALEKSGDYIASYDETQCEAAWKRHGKQLDDVVEAILSTGDSVFATGQRCVTVLATGHAPFRLEWDAIVFKLKEVGYLVTTQSSGKPDVVVSGLEVLDRRDELAKATAGDKVFAVAVHQLPVSLSDEEQRSRYFKRREAQQRYEAQRYWEEKAEQDHTDRELESNTSYW